MDNTQFDKMMQGMFQGMAELRESQAKSQAKADLESQKLREFQAETSLQIREFQAETGLQIREMGRRVDDVAKQLGHIGINTGDFAEELFWSSLKANPVLGGTLYNRVVRNVWDDEGNTEYDILLFNHNSVAIIEVKYKAKSSDIKNLLKKVDTFRNSHPDHAKHNIYLGLATTIRDRYYEKLVAKATEAGIYLLGQEGNHVELLSDKVRIF
ncbi:hypothetical protein P0082_11485 [Candidatus Haliotispira prima]|uniref:DUF3782 domain-containing protein n=1 Tax=Candidatus Haliotispira prima TaxID=3034016 RepID=A0ABY8MIR0_9SPIO|nr:hypothetical protein P0082_11485 [Candidatus Haliotispira prima]